MLPDVQRSHIQIWQNGAGVAWNFTKKALGKIKNFLNGNFLIDVDMIINYLLIQKEMEKEDIVESIGLT